MFPEFERSNPMSLGSSQEKKNAERSTMATFRTLRILLNIELIDQFGVKIVVGFGDVRVINKGINLFFSNFIYGSVHVFV